MMTTGEKILNHPIISKFINFSIKMGQQRHLMAIKDAFFYIMPLSLLAGFIILINHVIFPQLHIWLPRFITAQVLSNMQSWGASINNGALTIGSLLIAPLVAYNLAKQLRYNTPISAAVVALASFVMLLPLTIELPVSLNTEHYTMEFIGIISFSALGPQNLLSGIIIGLVSCELFVYLNKKRLTIKLPAGVPSGVAHSFDVLLPTIITTVTLASSSFLLNLLTGLDLMGLITLLIQTPLRFINNSLIGFLTLFSIGNLLFAFGIHQTVINSTFTDPFLNLNFTENMLAFSEGAPIEHILTSAFKDNFLMIGGTGSTLSLLLAILIFGKQQQSRELGKLALPASIFNINEPVIFGLPIIFNLPLIIPFILIPIVNGIIAYTLISLGLVAKAVVTTPWTMPPIFSGYLTTGGDWRAAALQVALIILNTFMYLPFLRMHELIESRRAQLEEPENHSAVNN